MRANSNRIQTNRKPIVLNRKYKKNTSLSVVIRAKIISDFHNTRNTYQICEIDIIKRV